MEISRALVLSESKRCSTLVTLTVGKHSANYSLIKLCSKISYFVGFSQNEIYPEEVVGCSWCCAKAEIERYLQLDEGPNTTHLTKLGTLVSQKC